VESEWEVERVPVRWLWRLAVYEERCAGVFVQLWEWERRGRWNSRRREIGRSGVGSVKEGAKRKGKRR